MEWSSGTFKLDLVGLAQVISSATALAMAILALRRLKEKKDERKQSEEPQKLPSPHGDGDA